MRGFFRHPHHGRHDDHHGRHNPFRNPFGGNPFERGGSPFGRGGRGEGRGFGHGGLRLVLLRLISEKPSHGYELIKEVEERFKGGYSPSPGVIYPTLNWLEDEGFITIQPGDDGRKSAHITEAGQAFLAEKAEEIDILFERMNQGGEGGEHGDYTQLMRAMGNLKMALKMRGMKPLNQDQIDAAVEMIDELARKVGKL
jgi:DNA-binding PadR family transcriptional regulator